MVWKLLQQLQRLNGLDLHVLLLNEGRLTEELRRLGLPVTVMDEGRLVFPQLLTRVHRFIREISPHIIHSHRFKENILGFMARGLKLKTKLISTQHGMPEFNIRNPTASPTLVARLNRYLLARRFDTMVAVSEDIKTNFVCQYGFDPARVTVIYNGFDLPERLAPQEARSSLIVGSAGRLFPVKDYSLMVRIAAEALADGQPLRFELAGEGPDRKFLETLISDLGIENFFRLRGHLDGMEDFYQNLDIYLNTSVHEGIPMSILEAMSHGIPVIAPKVGGMIEIITDGVDGFLIPDRCPSSFAEKILLLQRDRELLRIMGTAAREKVASRFSAEAMARQYERLYRSLVGMA